MVVLFIDRNKYSFSIDSFMVNDVSFTRVFALLRPTELQGQ